MGYYPAPLPRLLRDDQFHPAISFRCFSHFLNSSRGRVLRTSALVAQAAGGEDAVAESGRIRGGSGRRC